MDEPLIRRLSLADIAGAVARSALQGGQDLARRKRVLSVDWDPEIDGTCTIRARVRGSDWKPYDVDVLLESDPEDGRIAIDGECTCPQASRCKHIAAALVDAIREANKRNRPQALPLPLGAVAVLPPPRPPVEALSAPLAAWLDDLARVEGADGEGYPADMPQRLIYLLDLGDARFGRFPRLVVSPVSTRLLLSGEISMTAQIFNPLSAFQADPPKYLRRSDIDILRRLELLSRSTVFGAHSGGGLVGAEGRVILEAILATGRARWQKTQGLTVTRGPVLQAELNWKLGSDASQHAEFGIRGDERCLALALSPPWYVNPATGETGPLETGLPPHVAGALLAAPPVPPGQSSLLRQAISARVPEIARFAPPELAPVRQVLGPPIPRVTLSLLEQRPSYGWQSQRSGPIPMAKLSFLYDSIELSEHDDRTRPQMVRDGSVFEIVRHQRAERAAKKLLGAAGFIRLARLHPYVVSAGPRNHFGLPDVPPDRAWLDFLYNGAPRLKAAGWDIQVEPSFPLQLVRGDGVIEADLREGSGIDWLELDLGVVVDGERFDLTPTLIAIISDPEFDAELFELEPVESDVLLLGLPDGRTLGVPSRRIWRMVRALRELYSAGMVRSKDAAIRFSAFDAASLAAVTEATEGDDVRWNGGERLRKLGELLRAADGIPRSEVPTTFLATLRPYQSRGVDWLQFLRAAELGAVLADDMGLGKTVQALAHLAIEKASGRLNQPALIICPTSVVPNWRQEAARFAPDLKVLVLQGLTRRDHFAEIAEADVVISTYPLLARDRETLVGQEWHILILDEAQAIKNPAAQAAKIARELKARQRLCLTGTPVENHLGELWSLFSFLSPGFLGDLRTFNKNWRKPIEVENDVVLRRQLARRVRPFLLRRTKAEVESDLPAKTEIIEAIEMEPAQRDLYDTVRLAMHERVREAISAQGLARSHIVLLDALLKMRQACCDPRLLKLPGAKATRARSAKFDRLMEMLPALLEDGRRILLFSQFTSMLALIEAALKEAQIPYVLLTGETRDREEPIRAFQAGEVPLFLISLKAGGVGLNLTAADTVIHYDPWWNPAVEDQATDRAHRIGQEKPVFVYRLVTGSSIEEKMGALKDRKRELAAGIFEADSGSALQLSEADIEELFAPA